ncbi:MAG: BtpA/SgcQ family protein [Candidatus Aenigmatarchaeota archaeon]
MFPFEVEKPIIGVVHLPPLPGSPDFTSMDDVVKRAMKDTESLVDGGVDGLIVENYGDKPFLKKVSKMTVSSLSVVCSKLRDRFELPMGINVLRNDWESALSIAKALQLSFARINVYIGCCAAAEGLIEGEAGKMMRFKRRFDVPTSIFADIQVKHAETLYPKDIKRAATAASERGMADALIVTGKRTGRPVDLEDLKKAKNSVGIPVLAGSGVDKSNVKEVLKRSDGAIIGTYFKEEGKTSNPVSEERVKSLMKEVKGNVR